MRQLSLFVALVVGICAFVVPAPRAMATGTPLHFCNKSSKAFYLAIGYFSPGSNDTESKLTGPFVSRGWFHFDPGECSTVANPFGARYLYWTGYNDGGPDAWNTSSFHSDSHFCIPNSHPAGGPFTFERQNASETDCTSDSFYSGYANDWVPVQEIDVVVDANAEYDG